MTRLRLGLSALLLALGTTVASAETLLMPDRAFGSGQNEVVWGISTLPNGTAFTIDYGDGSTSTGADCGADTVVDRSYIACLHNYALAGTYTVTLTVGAESDTAVVQVYNLPSLTDENRRNVNINRAIQDGLRWFWFSSGSRTTYNTSVTTNWDSSPSSTALIVLAFMNHGYTIPNNASDPVGIYPKYMVRRGLNFIFQQLEAFAASGNNLQGGVQCDGLPDETAGAPHNCTLYRETENFGYSTSIVIAPLAGSNALNRVVTEGLAGNGTNGRTIGDILKRLVNGLGVGQADGPGVGRGGWQYGFNANTSDGSTIGWNMLALLDAEASGVDVPNYIAAEFVGFAYEHHKNTDGSFDYTANNDPATNGGVGGNLARAAVGLQAAFLAGDFLGDPYVTAATNYINTRWDGVPEAGDYTATCGSQGQNLGCGYAMFNVFKGFRLQGIATIPASTRPAGPGAIPAGDWYAEYVDYLVNNQHNPQTTGGGAWQNANTAGANRFGGTAGRMLWSECCGHTVPRASALAELILAPVALVNPDPDRFSTVGLSPAVSTGLNGTQHTVTAEALSQGGTPVVGATVTFQILTGPNAGAAGSGSDITDAQGRATFTYTDTVGNGQDRIQAFIGSLGSNVVTRNWVPAVTRCDVNDDDVVNAADLTLIRARLGQAASGATDPADGNGDGVINVADMRYCQLRFGPVN